VLILNVSRGKNFIFLLLLLLFMLTKFAQITPWMLTGNKSPNWADKASDDTEDKLFALHVPTTVVNAVLPIEDILFVRDLFRKNTGTVGRCVEFLREHAASGDLVITNYESEPLYFHTGLAQGMKIMRQDPIYEAARNYGLPDYVFGVDHARWVGWRFNWDDVLGIHWPQVADHLVSEGGQITEVAKIKETAWENRENIHFHRFSGDVYVFLQDTALEPAKVFRVDWPTE
jgi:hypothetical protein